MKQFFLLISIFILVSYQKGHAQRVVYQPGNGGGPGSNGAPSSAQQEQEIARRRGEELKRRREEAARAAKAAAEQQERQALADYKTSVDRGTAVAHTWTHAIDSAITTRKNISKAGKLWIENAKLHLSRLDSLQKLSANAKNSTEAHGYSQAAERELIVGLGAINRSENIEKLNQAKSDIVKGSYTHAQEKLAFAKSSIETLTELKKELVEKTSDITSDFTLAKLSAAKLIKDAANLVKSYLSNFIPPQEAAAIEGTQAFIEKLIESTAIEGNKFTYQTFVEAYKIASYKAFVAQKPILFIPDKIISTVENMESWDKINQTHTQFKKHVSDQIKMLDESIERYKKIVDKANLQTRLEVDNGINIFLNKADSSVVPTRFQN